MRLESSLLPALLLLAGCATTTDQMTQGPPFRTYASAHNHADIGQCIARSLSNVRVIPGTTETIVNLQDRNDLIHATWVIGAAPGGGSTIRLWRANATVGGLAQAERCF